MISIAAPKMVIVLPQNSLPNNNPSPIPLNIPIIRPDLFIIYFLFLFDPQILKDTLEHAIIIFRYSKRKMGNTPN